MTNIPDTIHRLIAADILGEELAEAERAKLDDWLEASQRHRDIYNRIKTLESADAIHGLNADGYGERMAATFASSHFATHGKAKKRPIRWAAAAAILALCGLFAGYLLFTEPEAKPLAEVITPGRPGAVLTLADGTRIELTRGSKTSIAAVIDSVFGTGHEPLAGLCTLRVEKGQEYAVTLADGTTVSLNSETSLRFPLPFAASERRVALDGEAYFSVTKDARHPFVVATDRGSVRVYGTRFTVTAYRNEPLRTVLVEGSIGFTSPRGNETRLAPGQQLTYDADAESVEVSQTDTEQHTAFAEDLFIFDDQPLEEIMTTLSRWYSCDVTFADTDSRSVRLSGRLRRGDDIRVLLDSYELTTGLKFKTEGRRITISK